MTAPFDFDFRKRQPDGALGRFVESIWYARGTVPYQRERIAPTGSTVAVFVLGAPIIETGNDGSGESVTTATGFMVGPHDRPIVNEPTGETFAVGVVATPIGAMSVFGVGPSSLRGRVQEIGEAWAQGLALRDQLVALSQPEDMLDLVEDHLTRTIRPPRSGIDRVEAAVATLEDDPTVTIKEVATELGVSHAHLDREFTTVVGLTPRSLARLLRMRRLLESIEVYGEVGWAQRAVGLGWYDQAHLIRDFKRHTGVTPTRYLEAQRSIDIPVDQVDAAGFVPQH